jgi:DNA-binding NtrC family response regulator
MSSNTSEAATTALNQEDQDNQTATTEQQAQDNSTATTDQDSQISTPSSQQPEAPQQTATTRPDSDNDPTASSGQAPQGSQSAVSGQQGEHGQTSVSEQSNNPQSAASEPGIQNVSGGAGGTAPHADDTAKMASEPKPDVSDQDYQELLPKLLSYFNNNREELARALGLHRSTVDRWLNGKSRPNNSTVLRMRRLAQERRIE